MKLVISFKDKEELLIQFERLKKQIEEGFTSGEIPSEVNSIYWDIGEYEEVDMRKVIEDIIEWDKTEIDDILFSLGMRVNQTALLK